MGTPTQGQANPLQRGAGPTMNGGFQPMNNLMRGMPAQFQQQGGGGFGAQPSMGPAGMLKPLQGAPNLAGAAPYAMGGSSGGGGIGYGGGAGPWATAPNQMGNPMGRQFSPGQQFGMATNPRMMDTGGLLGSVQNAANGITKPMQAPQAPMGGPQFPGNGAAPVQPAMGQGNPFAGPNNGTDLDRYRQAGNDAPAYLGQGFSGVDPRTGYQYANGTIFNAEGMTQSGDKSVPGFAFQNWAQHYGIPLR